MTPSLEGAWRPNFWAPASPNYSDVIRFSLRWQRGDEVGRF